ncbi:MAG: GIY-YIG nuclease family protein [Ardenticatenaceae bacterium]|nr:GIY-YIG nuclease family protein [Ardenticatenaceae bacterium]
MVRLILKVTIYTDDAPKLENALHKKFESKRLNLINLRKEFFHVSIDEIAQEVKNNHGEIEFTLAAEATEYRQTIQINKEEKEETKAKLPDRKTTTFSTSDKKTPRRWPGKPGPEGGDQRGSLPLRDIHT